MAKPRNEGLKNKILELRDSGKTYKEIREILNCSQGTIWHYLNRYDSLQTNPEYRAAKIASLAKYKKANPLKVKISTFFGYRRPVTIKKDRNASVLKILVNRIENFIGDESMKNKPFTEQDLLDKIGNNPKCYLSGRDIDLSKSSTYHLDHIIPTSKGGSNTLDNCNIASKQANQSKSDMTIDEYLSLCRDVLENFGYKVNKPDVTQNN